MKLRILYSDKQMGGMDNDWAHCKNILCIRADNMGDLLMSSPAIRALKAIAGAKITVLTSSLATGIAKHLAEIDETITFDLPWVKIDDVTRPSVFNKIVEEIKSRNFDAAVIFTVYSQNSLPAVMLAYLAEIPLRLAYCRENPYQLLTHWVPDKEPYTVIKHQVRRDLDLVKMVGSLTDDDNIILTYPMSVWQSVKEILAANGVDLARPFILAHAGVSEKKREYPYDQWVDTAKKIINATGHQILFTGVSSEKPLTDGLARRTGDHSYSMAGQFTLEQFIALIAHAPLLISVNTGPTHIAAATGTPLIVLYALSNPQHAPWKAFGKVLAFDIDPQWRSKNEVIRYVNEHYFLKNRTTVSPDEIVRYAIEILDGKIEPVPEIVS